MAGSLPTPNRGIINARSASDGTVCKIDTKLITYCDSFSDRVKAIPRGTATSVPNNKATKEIKKCSPILERSSTPFVCKKLIIQSAPFVQLLLSPR